MVAGSRMLERGLSEGLDMEVLQRYYEGRDSEQQMIHFSLNYMAIL